MSIFLDLSLIFDITGSMGDIPSQMNRSTENPLITSLRKIPRDSMEEPEVEYISTPVKDSNINEVINAEVLS